MESIKSGVIRDRAENEPMIDLKRERRPLGAFESRYDNAFDKIQERVNSSAN